MKNIRKVGRLKARAVFDEPVDDKDHKDFKFYVIEGNCSKCAAGPTSLIWYDLITNKRDSTQNIMKTTCLCCGSREVHFISDIELAKTSSEDPPGDTLT